MKSATKKKTWHLQFRSASERLSVKWETEFHCAKCNCRDKKWHNHTAMPVIRHKWEDSYAQQGVDGLLKFYQLQCNFAIQEVLFFRSMLQYKVWLYNLPLFYIHIVCVTQIYIDTQWNSAETSHRWRCKRDITEVMEVGFLADIVIATCLTVVVTYTTGYVGECKNNLIWLERRLSKWLSSQDWFLGTVNPFHVSLLHFWSLSV